MRSLLRGIDFPPFVVGFARGFVEAVAFGAVAAAVVYLSDGENVPDQIEFAVPSVIWGIRSIEGLLDQIDPAKKRAEG